MDYKMPLCDAIQRFSEAPKINTRWDARDHHAAKALLGAIAASRTGWEATSRALKVACEALGKMNHAEEPRAKHDADAALAKIESILREAGE